MNPSTSSPTEPLSRLIVSQKVLTNDPTTVSSETESPESPVLIRRRKIFGTCKGCGQPNTNFNECQSCIQWLNESDILTLKSLIIRRKSLIHNQSCNNCNQPKHIHYKIAACGNCGFPEYDVMDLYDIAIQDIYDDDDYDHDDDEDEEFTGIKISDLPCSRCDLPMTSWLKCPDYDEVIDMICMELNEMDYDDPDYQKLWTAKEHYEKLLQQDDQWVTDEGYDDDDDETDEYDEEYERYGIIDPMTALSILGLQKTISTTSSSFLFKFAGTN